MIELKKIQQTECTLHAPDGSVIGTITDEFTLGNVRIQIAKQQLSGYYVVFQGDRIDIDSNGDLSRWPRGFYDEIQKQFAELVRIRRSRK
jgi:predicted ATPase